MNKNIFRCRVCGRRAISEELDEHECRSLKDYKIVGNTLRVFDGQVWYPLKLDQAYPTIFDKENYRRRLDRTPRPIIIQIINLDGFYQLQSFLSHICENNDLARDSLFEI